MANEFNVPPVVFPSSTAAASSLSNQRRHSTASLPSTPRAPSAALPFLSFDIGSAPAPSSFSAAPAFSSPLLSDKDLPLLEELGINIR